MVLAFKNNPTSVLNHKQHDIKPARFIIFGFLNIKDFVNKFYTNILLEPFFLFKIKHRKNR